MGEVCILDCVQVGSRAGKNRPWRQWGEEANYLWSPENVAKHCVLDPEELQYQKAYAWVLAEPHQYERPRPYTHPRGCVTWVRLPAEVDETGAAANTGSEHKEEVGRLTCGVGVVLPEAAVQWAVAGCSARMKGCWKYVQDWTMPRLRRRSCTTNLVLVSMLLKGLAVFNWRQSAAADHRAHMLFSE